MDVPPVMDTMIATKCFFHQSNRFRSMALASVILVQIALFLMSSCQPPESTLGAETDITEDLYHRLKAGLFEPGRHPVICRILKNSHPLHKLRIPFYSEEAPHEMVRFSWERGSFWVKSNDRALVVIYMDVEATYSHVQMATLERFNNSREFRKRYEHPIR